MTTLSWIKLSPSLTKGVQVINTLEDTKLEPLLRRIVLKVKLQDKDIFTHEEINKLLNIFKIDNECLQLAIKSIIFVFMRVLKFVFMPKSLKNDFKNIGFNSEKADALVKVWSTETRNMLNDLSIGNANDKDESLNFSWKLNAELSSNVCKKSKISKVYLSLANDKKETELELSHPELYSMYLQFEELQNELDTLLI